MPIRYTDLGLDKRLNEIVFAGSHDAGINEGGGNVKTQNLNIKEQARAGVRIFDLRIAAQSRAGTGQGKTADLRAYHGAASKPAKSRIVEGSTNQQPQNVRVGLKYGEFGMHLTDMLQDAQDFVLNEAGGEFLILKFDKCTNWPVIAEACVRVLGDALYTGQRSLNEKTLRQLGSHVIVVFTQSGLDALGANRPAGILGIKNLLGGDGYNDDYDGLQYYGKGGTLLLTFFSSSKIAENKKKQGRLMNEGIATDPNVMGMMYWTSTGTLESIKHRNDTMWNKKNVSALQKLWGDGLQDSIYARLPDSLDTNNYAAGPVLKAFMPNMVMIDFADDRKCQTIYDLNGAATTALSALARIDGGA